MSNIYIMTLPHLGEGVESADVSEVLVSPGDKINKDDPIVVLESEKASMEIPSDISGTIKDVFITEETIISTGDKLISIQEGETTTEHPHKVETETKTPKELVKTTVDVL